MKIAEVIGPVARGDVVVVKTEDGKYWDVEAVTELKSLPNSQGLVWSVKLDTPVLVLKRER